MKMLENPISVSRNIGILDTAVPIHVRIISGCFAATAAELGVPGDYLAFYGERCPSPGLEDSAPETRCSIRGQTAVTWGQALRVKVLSRSHLFPV